MTPRTDFDRQTPHTFSTAMLERQFVGSNANKETSQMLIYEQLARARIQEQQDALEGRRHARRARAARRWDRVARWAAHRAAVYSR